MQCFITTLAHDRWGKRKPQVHPSPSRILSSNVSYFFEFPVPALDVQGCGVTENSANTILQMMTSNKTLVVLDLRNNDVCLESLSKVRAALRNNERGTEGKVSIMCITTNRLSGVQLSRFHYCQYSNVYRSYAGLKYSISARRAAVLLLYYIFPWFEQCYIFIHLSFETRD